MHPHLGLHAHPKCTTQIEALHACHADYPVRKFMGVCNETRRLLDVCLGEEFEENRRKNVAISKERNKRIINAQQQNVN
jgi:COX assembly protein 2